MLQTRTIEPGALGLLKRLMSLPELGQFYLVRGTALALQMGHRISVDLDFFTSQPFDKPELLDLLNAHFEEILLESEGASMLITNINQVKVAFVKMGYSVTYFEDAEKYTDPSVFDKTVTWKKVKKRVLEVVQELV